ncbi:MAG TPA: 30S ribosomal protein S6 [Candidatus Paceibacterota bacterium]|nr:30S ribosomal protein S6 [Candidatus Paceibacterota bacterium]
MNREDIDKKEYEISLLLKNEADLANVLTLVGQHGGEISSETKARNLALAYEIKKHKEAVFAYCNFRAYPDDAKNLEHDLNSRTDVLRFMIIASPPAAEKISPMGPGAPRRPRRAPRTAAPTGDATAKPQAPRPLSNEALEKKIEEILQ